MSTLSQFGKSLSVRMESNDDDPNYPDIQQKYIAFEDACWWIACGTYEEPGLGPYWLQGWLGDRSEIAETSTKNKGRYELATEQLVALLFNQQRPILGIVSESEVPPKIVDESDLHFYLRRSFLVESRYLADFDFEREDGYFILGDVEFEDLLLDEEWLLSAFSNFAHSVQLKPQEQLQSSPSAVHPNEGDASLDEPRRGRRPKWDWGEILVEIIALANTPDGLPETQASLERWVADYCQRIYSKEPSPSMIRLKVAPIYDRLRQKGR